MFKKIGLISVAASMVAIGAALTFSSCTDDFEEINTNPNKVYNVDLNDVFAGTVQRTMNNWAKMNYRRFLNFSRFNVVYFCTTPDQDTGDEYFRTFYVDVLRDLVKLEREYAQNPEAYNNRMAIVKIWKSYVYYTMASCWGPVPMSDAITDGSENKRSYKYDSELEVYSAILDELKEAVTLIDTADPSATADKLASDPIFGADGVGAADMTKWRKFAVTLRLNVAMHVQNLDIDLARTHALEAIADGGFITSNADNVIAQWGLDAENSSSQYYRDILKDRKPTDFGAAVRPACNEYGFLYFKSFNDPRMEKYYKKSNADVPSGMSVKSFLVSDTITRPHVCSNRDIKGSCVKCPDYNTHRADGMNAFRRDSIIVNYTVDYAPYMELTALPTNWRWATVPGMTYTYNDPLLVAAKEEYNWSMAADYFWNETAHWNILTYADACFLRAEAQLLFNNDPSAARAAYEEGIRASMSQWDCEGVTEYMAQNGVKWGTSAKGFHDRRLLYQAEILGDRGNEGLLEQIYKQRAFADYFNGLEIWNLERRTRAFNWPPFFMGGGSSNVEGYNLTYNYWNERLIYPEAEATKNSTANAEAIQMLRKTSPFVRDERWGDNVFTSLGFAKRNPQLDNADALWLSREITPRMDYYEHTWGATWEECSKNAIKATGAKNESAAFRQIEFAFASQLGVYSIFDF